MSGYTYKTVLAGTDDVGIVAAPTQFGSWTVDASPAGGVNDPSFGASAPGQEVRFVTSCSDPDGWHNIATVDLRIAEGDGTGHHQRIVLDVQFDENRQVVRFFDPDSGTWQEGQPGSSTVLRSRYSELRLAGTSVQGSGPTGGGVHVTWDVAFTDAALGRDFLQQVQVTDDAGVSTGFDRVGRWVVG
jgi:hypothetical protein